MNQVPPHKRLLHPLCWVFPLLQHPNTKIQNNMLVREDELFSQKLCGKSASWITCSGCKSQHDHWNQCKIIHHRVQVLFFYFLWWKCKFISMLHIEQLRLYSVISFLHGPSDDYIYFFGHWMERPKKQPVPAWHLYERSSVAVKVWETREMTLLSLCLKHEPLSTIINLNCPDVPLKSWILACHQDYLAVSQL